MCTRCVKSDLSISNENQAKWFLPRRLTYLRHCAIIVVVMFTYKSANHLCSKTWISHVVHDTPHNSTKREITYHGFLTNVSLLEFLVSKRSSRKPFRAGEWKIYTAMWNHSYEVAENTPLITNRIWGPYIYVTGQVTVFHHTDRPLAGK